MGVGWGEEERGFRVEEVQVGRQCTAHAAANLGLGGPTREGLAKAYRDIEGGKEGRRDRLGVVGAEELNTLAWRTSRGLDNYGTNLVRHALHLQGRTELEMFDMTPGGGGRGSGSGDCDHVINVGTLLRPGTVGAMLEYWDEEEEKHTVALVRREGGGGRGGEYALVDSMSAGGGGGKGAVAVIGGEEEATRFIMEGAEMPEREGGGGSRGRCVNGKVWFRGEGEKARPRGAVGRGAGGYLAHGEVEGRPATAEEMAGAMRAGQTGGAGPEARPPEVPRERVVAVLSRRAAWRLRSGGASSDIRSPGGRREAAQGIARTLSKSLQKALPEEGEEERGQTVAQEEKYWTAVMGAVARTQGGEEWRTLGEVSQQEEGWGRGMTPAPPVTATPLRPLPVPPPAVGHVIPVGGEPWEWEGGQWVPKRRRLGDQPGGGAEARVNVKMVMI